MLPSTTPLKSTHKPEVALVASKPDFRFIVISGFYPFLARFVNQRTLYSPTINKMILMIIEVYGPEICVMARSRGATSGLSSVFIYY